MAVVNGHRSLGSNVAPSHYSIEIKPDMQSHSYQGSEAIDVSIARPTRSIRLNAKGLSVTGASITIDGTAQQAAVSYDEDNEELVLRFDRPVSGDAKLELKFNGENNDKMYGFYRSSYTDNGTPQQMLTTQFEAADARAAFPCFDEPAFKATFDLTLVVDKGLEAVSNMPVASRRSDGGKEVITFGTTPMMSSYLLYMGVGQFERVTEKVGNVEISVLTTPGKSAYAKLPLEYAKKAVEFYQSYFGIAYPLPKIDLIAIPDFAAGAMENWGAITFRESALLCNDSSSQATKQAVAETIAHELAHQWFGNLVTMKWWDDLWLNESFATYMSFKALDDAHPEWDVMLQYLSGTTSRAMSADQLRSTHPINVKVSAPAEIDRIFDEISYQKGGSVLHMLEDYVGADAFRRGLAEYLGKNAYSNATKEDLWLAIEHASGDANVSKIMRHWVNVPGYPVIKVKKVRGGFELRQKKFTIDGERRSRPWPIPLVFETEDGTSRVLMDSKKLVIKTQSDWIKLNAGQAGLYRASYDEATLERLGKLVEAGRLGGADAWGIENDLFAMARCGLIEVRTYLNFVASHCNDPDYPLSESTIGHLSWLAALLRGNPLESEVNAVIEKLAAPILAELGWSKRPGERDVDTLLRGQVISALGEAGDPQVIDMADDIFRNSFTQGMVDANLRSAIYKIVAMNGDGQVFDSFVSRYKAESDPEERLKLLSALGHFRDPALVDKALEITLTEAVRLQDSTIIPSVVGGNEAAIRGLMLWTESHWQEFMARYPSGTHLLEDFVDSIGMAYGRDTLAELKAFFSKPENRRDDIEVAVKHLLERVAANTRVIERNGQAETTQKSKSKNAY